MTASNLTDTCECSYADDYPPALPSQVTYTADGTGLLADYACSRCGRTWWTSWDARSAGWPVLPPRECSRGLAGAWGDSVMLPELLTRIDVACPLHGPVLRLSADQGDPGDWLTRLECPEPGCGYEVRS